MCGIVQGLAEPPGSPSVHCLHRRRFTITPRAHREKSLSTNFWGLLVHVVSSSSSFLPSSPRCCFASAAEAWEDWIVMMNRLFRPSTYRLPPPDYSNCASWKNGDYFISLGQRGEWRGKKKWLVPTQKRRRGRSQYIWKKTRSSSSAVENSPRVFLLLLLLRELVIIYF